MNYSGLKDAVRAVIKENGNEEITGDILQQTLIAIINALGVGYQFMGVATPDTAFGTPDSRQFYIATEPGTYGSTIVTLDGSKVAILLFADSWNAITLDVPTVAGLSEYLKISDLATAIGSGENTAMTQKATTEAIIAAINAALLKSDVVQSLGDDATKVLSQAAITTVLMGYAKINGVYPELVAGLAQNLVGRGSVSALFTFRTTGGSADVGNGAAQIKKLYGNSVVWNDLAPDNANHYTGTGGGTSETINGVRYFSINSTHKYAVIFSDTNIIHFLLRDLTEGYTGTLNNTNKAIIAPIGLNSNGTTFLQFYATNGVAYDTYVRVHDLTLMFGAGKEPATVEEFEALYYLKYYAQNLGAIKNTAAIWIKTVGRNLFNPATGKAHLPVATGVADLINGINCYQIIGNYTSITDESGNAIVPNSGGFFAVSSKQEITVVGGDDTTCICLTWSGYRNGEYEPYWEYIINLPLTTMTGKLNGAGNSVTIFPDGMKSAGSVFDETNGATAIKRLGIVDLGNLNWNYNSSFNGFIASISNTKNAFVGICSKYEYIGAYTNLVDKSFGYIYNNNIIVKDTSFNEDAAAFKTAMSGVYLVYELATPEEYVLDTPLELNYKEDDFGTEQKLPEDTASSVSAPLLIDVQYPMNAVDALRRLPVNYISKESFDAFCAELATKLGAAIGKTITITSTFNTEQGKYNFTITIV